MITVYYTNINDPCNEAVLKKLLGKVDFQAREKVRPYKSVPEQIARLSGRLLLNKLFCDYDLGEGIDALKYDQWGKPFIGNNFDFNISHSGNMVICAGVRGAKIGVDIEKEDVRDISNMHEYFTAREWNIISGGGINTAFYKMWVRKEACLKAIGKGLFLPLHEVDVCDGEVILDNSKWFLHDVCVKDGYAACIVTNKQNESISIEEIDIHTLINN